MGKKFNLLDWRPCWEGVGPEPVFAVSSGADFFSEGPVVSDSSTGTVTFEGAAGFSVVVACDGSKGPEIIKKINN